jgi:hypothetical protein
MPDAVRNPRRDGEVQFARCEGIANYSASAFPNKNGSQIHGENQLFLKNHCRQSAGTSNEPMAGPSFRGDTKCRLDTL